jgi:hypothetical protein
MNRAGIVSSVAAVAAIALGVIAAVAGGAAPAAGVDIQALVDDAIQKGAAEVTIPPGTYRVAPPGKGRGSHLNIRGAKNLTINATGVLMICTTGAQAVDVVDCTNLTLTGLTIDYDPLSFTQGVVTAWAPDGSYFEVTLDKGYPQNPGKNYSRMDLYDPKTLKIKPDHWTISAEKDREIIVVEPGKVRVPWGNKANRNNIEVGDLIALCGGGSHGIGVTRCSHCTFRDVTIYTGFCFGVIEYDGEGANRYINLGITPGPTPPGATRPRLRSMTADGFHSKRTHIGPTLENCRIECTGDDAIAINGAYAPVFKAAGKELVIAEKVAVGDRIRVVSDKVVVRGEAVVRKVVPITDAAAREALAAAWLEHSRDKKRQPRINEAYAITVDADLGPALGDRVSFPDRNGAGFVVRKCLVRNNRARGILIKASKGVIEDNIVDGSTIAGIVLCPEFYWNEACFSRDVTIRGNTVRATGLGPANWGSLQAGAITVAADSSDGKTPAAGGHRDIRIENNTIEGCPGPCIEITSAENVTVIGNRFVNTHPVKRANGERFHIDTEAVIWLDNDTNVKLEKNTVTGMGPFGKRFLTATEGVKGLVGAGDVTVK